MWIQFLRDLLRGLGWGFGSGLGRGLASFILPRRRR